MRDDRWFQVSEVFDLGFKFQVANRSTLNDNR